jgi:hypothetical protein
MAFYYFATGRDLEEIFAELEAEAPVRIVHEHNKTGTEKACFLSALDIPGLTDDEPSARFRSSFLMFPFHCEPVMTEVEAPTRTLMCVYRTDNPAAVDITQPSMLYVSSFPRPELIAGEIRFFAMNDYPGEPGPTPEARALANRIRKAIRKRSCLIRSEGTKRIYIARRALEAAQAGEIDLTCCHLRWSAAESADDAAFLGELELPRAAMRPVRADRNSHANVTPIRNYRVRNVAFSEPAEPDVLFAAAFDDLAKLFEAASPPDDLNYSRLGPPRFRSICQDPSDIPGLGATTRKREIESGIIAWRGKNADYRRVHEPFGLADYRIGLLPDGYTSPSMIVFPGGAHLRGAKGQPKRLFCGYARLVHDSGRDHFEAFRVAVADASLATIRVPDLPVDIPVLPQAKALIESGVEIDASLLSMHMLHYRIAAKPDNVVIFPERPGTGSG